LKLHGATVTDGSRRENNMSETTKTRRTTLRLSIADFYAFTVACAERGVKKQAVLEHLVIAWTHGDDDGPKVVAESIPTDDVERQLESCGSHQQDAICTTARSWWQRARAH